MEETSGVSARNVPAGGVACPSVLSPQQATAPLVLIAQVWPAAGAERGEGRPKAGSTGRRPLSPQQTTAPSPCSTPQVWELPVVTAGPLNSDPVGVSLSPSGSAPQHAARPLILTPQVWNHPALTVVNVPAGGLDWPEPLSPQQASVRLAFNPQLWSKPALTAVKAPAGGLDSPAPLAPQQARLPLLLTPHVWPLPALTAMNPPEGGVAWPAVVPQHASVPLIFTAQA